MINAEELIKKYNDFESEKGWKLTKKEDFTCNRCDRKESCKCAWDLYNTGGDCLAEK